MEIINEGNHVHIAHTSNRKLKRLRRWARRHNAGPVHEFKPGPDHLDCVHTTFSKHYQVPRNPFGRLTCNLWYAVTDDDKKRHNCAADFQGPNRIAVLNKALAENSRANSVRKLVPGLSPVEIRTAVYESSFDDPRSRC